MAKVTIAGDVRAALAAKVAVVEQTPRVKVNGKVTKVVGLVMEGYSPGAAVGEFCSVYPKTGGPAIECEVVGFSDDKVVLMPLGDLRGVGPGSAIVRLREHESVVVGKEILGRVIDGLGNPIDGLGPIKSEVRYPLYGLPRNPLERRRIDEPCSVGIRVIDGLITIGKGQKIGIFAGSGVGKSVLLGMMGRGAQAAVNVIALVGERGREVKEFIEKDLGPEGLKRSVLVVATSDAPPLARIKAALTAAAIAEYWRDQGADVLFMMDSISRFAAAQREVGLAAGESPATKGYPPSVFALLPRLIERAGRTEGAGTITAFYTILTEGDDLSDPVADACRALLDGHITLSRELAGRGHYPAVDVLASISRVMGDVVTPGHIERSIRVRAALAAYAKAYDLISIGAYKAGSDPTVDHAIKAIDKINSFLRQQMRETVAFEDSVQCLFSLPI
ncbi:MAG: EscN/YscN/HrcN family type III secretion system ATPase [Deltaproteobacteria bacterium RIFCSPLOWO2_02_FULL_53_8]|nr:MAG: EscN/YscN/HrcN family type III secretion system ATPase [Deltaproteobacteria bacterium RIFCSPLOWO2_02_FULL_53_8]